MYFRLLLLSLYLLVIGPMVAWAQAPDTAPGLAKDREGYADASSCKGCHAPQAAQWKDSDHAWAMREATPGNVLGAFDGRSFDEAGVKARFLRKGEHYYVNTEGADGKTADFRVRYTFGYRPLQQYLVEFPGGRLQALTLAWDSRSKQDGGQRWFSLYPGQRFAPDDALHWTGRYQNWNGMCADCHSTRLLKHYDDQHDRYATTWQEQTVGCQGCHGPGQAHVDWAKQANTDKPYATASDMQLSVDFKALDSKGLIEQCAFCHSRRQSLGTGQQPGKPQLDASLPATLREGLYHADGQIDGEVYVYGSFTQSKMYAAGVSCTDCHDPHTTRVKLEGNTLCQQCHSPHPPSSRFPSLQARNYDTPEHHHHAQGSPGAQCVNCHMPSKTYMVVDPRRDHSFRVPRPDLARKTASPDACTACHTDKQPQWAATAIEGWFGAPKRPAHYGEAFHAVRAGQGDRLNLLTAVIADIGKPSVVRATAAQQLAELGPPAITALGWALNAKDGAVRAYAAAGFARLDPQARVRRLLPLLNDPLLAVRDEALRALADVPLDALPAERREGFTAQLADYERRLRENADLPGGRLNLAVLLQREGREQEAIAQYQEALRLDAHFTPARVNLVTLYSNTGQLDAAQRQLREGLALEGTPAGDHGNLAYMLALLLVEQGQGQEGVKWLGVAAKEMPDNARVFYNQGLLLAQLDRRDEALQALHQGLASSPDNADLLYALIYLHSKAGELELVEQYVERMRKVVPDDPRLPPIRQ